MPYPVGRLLSRGFELHASGGTVLERACSGALVGEPVPCADRPVRALCCRGDSGLTTLEWLLITAAVAGLAALAVVLVQAQVEGTADQVANPDSRMTSAIYSAFDIETGAKSVAAGDFDSWADWEIQFRERCSLLAALYGDAEVEVVHNSFNRAAGGTAFDSAAAGYAAAADEQPATAAKAQVRCEVR